jgi:hypothetical protein
MPEDAALRPVRFEDLPHVEGTVLYMTPMAEKPQVLAYQVAEGGQPPTNARYEPRTVRVVDARPVADLLSLDVEGVAFAPHRSAVKDWSDEAELDSVAHAEAAELVKRATGARRVEVFDHTFRRNQPETADRTPGAPRQPVTRAHNDYTEWSAPQRIRDLMPEEAEALLQRRYAFVNVWRPTRGPVQESPLGVCDARSSRVSDFVACDLIYEDRKGEIYTVTWSPEHRWLYFPQMTVDETILIKCFDSRADVARWSAHSAFTDPTSPPGAPARESLEIRTVAFF